MGGGDWTADRRESGDGESTARGGAGYSGGTRCPPTRYRFGRVGLTVRVPVQMTTEPHPSNAWNCTGTIPALG